MNPVFFVITIRVSVGDSESPEKVFNNLLWTGISVKMSYVLQGTIVTVPVESVSRLSIKPLLITVKASFVLRALIVLIVSKQLSILITFLAKCVKDEPITTEDIDPDPLCRDVKCPTGFTCSTLDGICHPHARHYSPDNFNNFNLDSLKLLEADSLTLMQCPQNAHYEECAAACTSTCMDIRPDCKQHDYDCIRSCVCDDGYVQVSVLNTTCVPAQKCLDVAKEDDFSK